MKRVRAEEVEKKWLPLTERGALECLGWLKAKRKIRTDARVDHGIAGGTYPPL